MHYRTSYLDQCLLHLSIRIDTMAIFYRLYILRYYDRKN